MTTKKRIFHFYYKAFIIAFILGLASSISFAADSFYTWNPGNISGNPQSEAVADMANWKCFTIEKGMMTWNTTKCWVTGFVAWPSPVWNRHGFALEHQTYAYTNATAENREGDWMLIPINLEPNRNFRIKLDAWTTFLIGGAPSTERFSVHIVQMDAANNIKYIDPPLISNDKFSDILINTFSSDVHSVTNKDNGFDFYLAIRVWSTVPNFWRLAISNIVMEYVNAYTVTGTITDFPDIEQNGSGTITPRHVSVLEGAEVGWVVAANDCSQISQVYVDGRLIMPEPPYTTLSDTIKNITGNHTITASFMKIMYKMTTKASPGCKITPTVEVPSHGMVGCGTNLTYNFAIEEGYAFEKLIVDNETFTAPHSKWDFTNIRADHNVELSVIPKKYTLTATVIGTGGSISPESATVLHGVSQTFTITPATGYSIASVIVDNLPVNNFTGNTYTFDRITANHTINVRFRRDGDYVLTPQASTGGQINTTQTTANEYTLTAVPAQCYNFANWTDLSGKELSQNNVLSVIMKSDSTVKANFTPITEQFSVTAKSSDEELGTVEALNAQNVECGTVLTIKATPIGNNTFVNWTDQNGNVLYFTKPGSNTQTDYMPEAELVVTRNMTVTANFSSNATLTLATNPPNLNTSLTGAGAYKINQVVNYAVEAVRGYKFINWTDATTGVEVSTSLANNITMTRNHSLVANFVKVQTLIVRSNPAGAATLSGLGVYIDGTYATFAATPKKEFTLINWTKEVIDTNETGDVIGVRQVEISTKLSDNILMDANYIITANFEQVEPVEPVVKTLAATDIASSTATLNGNITNIGVPVSTAYGFEYSTESGFNSGTSITMTSKIAAGTYKTTAHSLASNTQYYFKAFVEYEGKRYYGEELSFTTTAPVNSDPVVTTTAATNITATTATLDGNISRLGYPLPTSTGFTYSASNDFANSTEIIVSDATTQIDLGDFLANISNLTPNTQYYFKAWVKVEDKKHEGEVVNFTTLQSQSEYTEGELDPKVAVSNLAQTSAVFTATLLSDGGTTENSELGFVYSKTQNPTIENATKLTVDNITLGKYTTTATTLESLTTYHVRGFYTNVVGTVYTQEAEFTTQGTGIEEIIKNTAVNLYPNPANETTTLSFDLLKGYNMKITLCDLYGKELMLIFDGFAADKFVKNIQTTDMVSGTYFIKIQIAGNSIIEKLIVK